MGVYRLSELVGHGTASLVVAAIAAALAAGAVAIAFRPRLALPALGVVGTLLALVGFGAWTLDARFSQRARETYLPRDASWIDSARVGPVTLVNTPGSGRELALEQMFWNRSVTRLVRLRNAGFPDKFAAPRVRIGGDGALLLRGRPVRGAVVFSEYAVTAELRGATSVAATKLFELWKPEGKPRLRLLAGGRYFDKWLANSGYVRIWDAPGTLRLRLVLPPRAPRSAMSFRARGVRRTVIVEPGSSRVVEFAVPRGVWTLRLK
jgi:hypothetical protein